MSTWAYAETVTAERIATLLGAPSFSVISDQIASEMKVACCHQQPCDDNRQFSRVVFCVQISPSLFDLFFNSPNGYRGMYYQSPYRGLEANAAVIRGLARRLLGWAASNCPDIDGVFAEESLSSHSAKVWLAECGSHLCEQCAGEWRNPNDDVPEILNRQWENEDSPKGRCGRKAPCLSKLRIFGAFLNQRHDEFVPARKRYRSMQIHQSGWS